MEVLGRLARRADLTAAELWFRRGAAAAEEGGLAVWRARALHELATAAQVRSFDLAPMHGCRVVVARFGIMVAASSLRCEG